MDDRELATQFGRGDETVVRALYERFGGPIHTVAMSMLRDRDLAAEAVQTTFLKAWRARDTFDPSRDLAPWLYQIARRVSVDILRRDRRAGIETTDTGEVDAAVVPISFERTWEAWEIRTALAALPDEERDVVRLAHFEGRSHADIAERLGIPVGTVKSRTSRAHRRLASALRHLVQEDQ